MFTQQIKSPSSKPSYKQFNLANYADGGLILNGLHELAFLGEIGG